MLTYIGLKAFSNHAILFKILESTCDCLQYRSYLQKTVSACYIWKCHAEHNVTLKKYIADMALFTDAALFGRCSEIER